jgi:hypothetical protein
MCDGKGVPYVALVRLCHDRGRRRPDNRWVRNTASRFGDVHACRVYRDLYRDQGTAIGCPPPGQNAAFATRNPLMVRATGFPGRDGLRPQPRTHLVI